MKKVGRLRIDYDFTRRRPRLSKLVVTVNSRDEKGLAPKTHNVTDFDASGRGSVLTQIALDPAKHYDVYTSIVAGDPPKPSKSTLDELDPTRREAKVPPLKRVASFLSKLIARIRGDR